MLVVLLRENDVCSTVDLKDTGRGKFQAIMGRREGREGRGGEGKGEKGEKGGRGGEERGQHIQNSQSARKHAAADTNK